MSLLDKILNRGPRTKGGKWRKGAPSPNPAGRPKNIVPTDEDIAALDPLALTTETLAMLSTKMRKGSETAARLLLEHNRADQAPTRVNLYLPLAPKSVHAKCPECSHEFDVNPQPPGVVIEPPTAVDLDTSVPPHLQTHQEHEETLTVESALAILAGHKHRLNGGGDVDEA